MQRAMISGARLAYVVRELEGTVTRNVHTYTKDKGLEISQVERPAGYLVYFPRGHVLRMTEQALKHYNLSQEPTIINMDGLADPKSPMGKLLMAQDDDARRGHMLDLEKQVIQLATARSGKDILPEGLTVKGEDEPRTRRRARA